MDRGEEGLGSDGSSVARPSLKRVSQRHRPGRERLAARVLHRAAGSLEPGGGEYKVPGQRAASFPTRRAGGGAGGVQSEGQAASRFTVLRRDSGEGSGTERAAFGFLRALADDGFGHGREHLGQRRGERPREFPRGPGARRPSGRPRRPAGLRAPTRWWPPGGRSSPRLELYGRAETSRAGR